VTAIRAPATHLPATAAIRLIDRYPQKHPGVHHVDDIADEIGIELRVAFAAAQKLLDRGRARMRER